MRSKPSMRIAHFDCFSGISGDMTLGALLDIGVDEQAIRQGLDLLGVERFTSRSVPTGSGMVQCAHGLMPIPAPGTAALLKGVPLARSDVKAELTTPTGAAILTTVVQEWIDQPVMTIERIGH